MAVTFDGTRIADAEVTNPATPVAGLWEDTGGGAAIEEPDYIYQGSGSISEKVKTAELGVCFIPTSLTYDVSNTIWLYKGTVTTVGIIETTRAAGTKIEMGSGATSGAGQPTDYYQWWLYTVSTYPAAGGWLFIPIDPNEEAFIDSEAGTVDTATVNYWAFVVTMTSALSKAENTAMDALEYYTSGEGLTWEGTGGDFQEFIDFDEGTTSNRYGIVSTREGIIYCNAVMTIGSATATEFSDSNAKVIWPWGRVSEGAMGMDIDLQNASTEASFSVCTLSGNGQSSVKKFFDTTSLEVDDTSEDITIPSHGWDTGDMVVYSRESGSDDIGLTTTSNYWVYVIDTSTVALHATRTSAYGDTTRVGLTAATAPGENHSLTRNPDNRIDFTVSGSSGIFSTDSCVIEGVRILTVNDTCTLTGGFVQNIGNVLAGSAVFSGVTIQTPTLEEGEALFDPLTVLTNITECTFVSGTEGHAIRFTAGGSIGSNNSYSGFWAPTDSGWNFHTQDGVSASTDIITMDASHGFVTGDAVYYNDEGGSDSVGLTHGNKYYVATQSSSTVTLHETRAAAENATSLVNIISGASGETHSLYSGNATFHNDSATAMTVNVTTGSDAPSVRNGTSASATILNTVDLTINTIDSDTNAVASISCAIFLASDDTELMNEDSDVTGVATQPYSYPGTVTSIYWRVREATVGAYYKSKSGLGTVTSTGFQTTVIMEPEPIQP